MRSVLLPAWLCLVSLAAAQVAPPAAVGILASPLAGDIRGGALSRDGSVVYTWGAGLYRWHLRASTPRPRGARRLGTNLQYGEGGCVANINGAGSEALVLEARPGSGEALGKLVWLAPPSWQPHVLDTGISMSDCIETTLLGKPGILMVQRHAQVRFYPYPFSTNGPASYQEVYSFYTASREAGLLRADVDGDGREDILCGNYWIQSPASFELPWRLFAIELYNQTEASANLRLALLPEKAISLVVAQKEMAGARVAVFHATNDGPQALWQETLLSAPGGFHFAAGLAVAEGSIFVGEHNGLASRLLEFSGHRTGGEFPLTSVRPSPPVVALLPGPAGIVIVTGRGVALLAHAGN